MDSRPKVALTPLEVLTESDPPREIPMLSQLWGPTFGAVVAFAGVTYMNWAAKRPLPSGVQRYVFATLGGLALGKWAEDYRKQYLADKDAVLRHYIELHPEDFPPFKRQKIGDLVERWIPIR